MARMFRQLFLNERPSLGLAFFRPFVALTVGLHVIPSFFCIRDNYFHTAFKTLNFEFFTQWFLALVQKSPDQIVILFVFVFCISWFTFLIGYYTQLSCIILMLSCYYFYALNSFPIGTLSWDILLVTMFLMCITPYPGDYFSIDALRTKALSPYKRTRPFFIQGLLQMQIAFTYFYTGLYKVSAAGNWWTGNPVYYLMNYPPEGVMKHFLFKEFFAGHPLICYMLGIATTIFELTMPVWLYWSRTRVSAIYLGFLFQLGLLLTMDVPFIFFLLFPAQLMLFLPPEDIIRWIEKRRAFNMRGGQDIVVFDGLCGFCRECVRALEIMDLFGALKYADYQMYDRIELVHPELTYQLAHSQLHLIEPDGTLSGGFMAFRKMCLRLPMLYPLVPFAYFPGSGILGPIIYRWVSENRYIFHSSQPCKDNACFNRSAEK